MILSPATFYGPAIIHSGANGDYQEIVSEGALHPVLRDPRSPDKVLRFLPAHLHEGSVSAVSGDKSVRFIANGSSIVAGVDFNLAVAFKLSGINEPAIAQTTFHHFADYNWDLHSGAPTSASEPPGGGWRKIPRLLCLPSPMRAIWLGGLVR